MSKKPYRINGKDVVVKAESVLYDGISGTDNVEGALDYLKENGGGGGLQPSDIVNDLTTGGADKALSAEMGKTLNGSKQDKLVSGTSLKTINNTSLLGSGNISIPKGDKGDKGDTGDVQVDGNGNVLIVNDLYSGGTGAALSAEMGKRLNTTKQSMIEVTVAANDAPAWQKAGADYVCDGTNDEVEIQAAVDKIANTGGRIRLSAGTFWIDSWQHTRNTYASAYGKCAIMIPHDKNCEYIIEGDTMPISYSISAVRGTAIRVSDALYNSTPSDEYCTIIGAQWANGYPQIAARGALYMSHLRFSLPWNQKPLMCVDTFLLSRVALQYIDCTAYSSQYDSGWTAIADEPCPIPAVGCVGVRSFGGSNWGSVADFKNIMVSGFREGFMLAGEHVVCVNLAALYCYYPYTFGNWNYTNITGHPMTLINCNEEHCCCGPYFANGQQQIDLLQYNGEIIPSRIPGGVRIQNATIADSNNAIYYGRVEYTMMVDTYVNKSTYRFWEEGHGHTFFSRNMTHGPAAGTNKIKSWSPDYMEMVYNTDMNLMLVCTNTATKEWRDMNGTVRITGS